MLKTARMCRARKGSDMAKLAFGMNQSLVHQGVNKLSVDESKIWG
jgi:hypothetical protein